MLAHTQPRQRRAAAVIHWPNASAAATWVIASPRFVPPQLKQPAGKLQPLHVCPPTLTLRRSSTFCISCASCCTGRSRAACMTNVASAAPPCTARAPCPGAAGLRRSCGARTMCDRMSRLEGGALARTKRPIRLDDSAAEVAEVAALARRPDRDSRAADCACRCRWDEGSSVSSATRCHCE